jgi:hypothetical protein
MFDSFSYDPEVPAGCQDADLLQAQYEAESARAAADRKRGICHHSWQLGRGDGSCNYSAEEIAADRAKGSFPDRPTDAAVTDQASIPEGLCLCLDCGQLVEDALAGVL